MIKYPSLAFIAVILGLIGILVQGVSKGEVTGYFLMCATLACIIRSALMSDWIGAALMLFLFICVAIITSIKRSKKKV